MSDVWINKVSTDVSVTDASALLTPPVMARIVQAVVKEVRDRQASDRKLAGEQQLGGEADHDRDAVSFERIVMAATYAKASFQRVDADDKPIGDRLDVQFNPTDLTMNKAAQIAEIAIPGLDSPILQFVRGQNEKVNLELFFDSTEDGTGLGAIPVTRQTNRFYALVTMSGKEHAPPRLLFAWGQEFPGLINQSAAGAKPGAGGSEVTGTRHAFRCIVESIQQKFTLFSPDGLPLRATLSVALREYKTLKHQLEELNLQSSDHTRVHIVQRGETLPHIAYAAYRDAARWRLIAEANNLRDARDLEPGVVLRLPPVRT